MPRYRAAAAVLCFAVLFSIDNSAGFRTLGQASPSASLAPAQVDALAGEYTDPKEPDSPISFYVDDGNLVTESDRMVPTRLGQNSPTEFALPNSRMTVRFTLDAAGRGASAVVFS